jgi:DNA-binding NarL/FixJ family response regulator
MDNAPSKGERTISVLVAERSPRLAIALSQILGKSDLTRVAGRCEDPKRLIGMVENLKPQVVLLNCDRPGGSLLELCKELRARKTGVVLLSTESRRGPVREALAAGASSIVSWPCRPRDLVLAVVNAERVTWGTGALSILPEAESAIAAEKALITDKLSPLMEWALRPDVKEVSTRLKSRE